MTFPHHLSNDIPTWAYAYGSPNGIGKIKTIADDFIVEEQLSFQPEGTGEHFFLLITKTGENTEYVARLLARFAVVRQRDVGYAGLKDRHAKTTQWFSIWMPGKEEPDWKQFETENIKISQTTRHLRKLKRGALSGNQFKIRIRDWLGSRAKLEQQLQQISSEGIPNYFGSQRFGHQGRNINKALSLIQGEKVKREQKSIYLSAARSYLFNQVLANRVNINHWNQAIPGDVFIFDQSRSYFKSSQLDSSILQRIKNSEIHPTGMMFGAGALETESEAMEIENLIIDRNQPLAEGLIKFGLKNERRALRVLVKNLHWELQQDSNLLLTFSLPAGSYATSLLRELIDMG